MKVCEFMNQIYDYAVRNKMPEVLNAEIEIDKNMLLSDILTINYYVNNNKLVIVSKDGFKYHKKKYAEDEIL